jgi:DMSO/TMAO reductase YedYZ molybdopterin-dependent catalytic subunit
MHRERYVKKPSTVFNRWEILMRYIESACLLAFMIACSCLAIPSSAQKTIPPSGASDVLLTVGGEVEHPLKLTRADLDKFARQTVRAKDHDGKEYNYEGVAIIDILQKAGLKFGDALRGKALATYLLVEAVDGYQAVYALPEFDPPTTGRTILLADGRDGGPLPATAASLQIIVPGDKTHARWVRQVKSLTIVRAPKSVGGQ